MSNKGPQSPAAGTPSSLSAASSSRSATKRLIKELAVWEKEAPAETGIERLGPVSEGELLQWEAVINGRGIGGGYDGTSALSIYLCILFATLHFFSIVVVYIYVYLDNQPPNLHSSFLLLSVPPPLFLFHSLWLTPSRLPAGKQKVAGSSASPSRRRTPSSRRGSPSRPPWCTPTCRSRRARSASTS